MSAPPIQTLERVRAAYARIGDAVGELLRLDLGGVGEDDARLAVLGERERLARQLDAAGTRLVAEVDARGVAFAKGYRNTAGLLRELLRIVPAEASARVKAAAGTGPRRALTGDPLEPIYGRVAEAQAAGLISAQHARLIVRTVDKLPTPVQDEHGEWLEQFLVQNAAHYDPTVLNRLAVRAVDTFDPDGALRDQAYRERTREFGLIRNQDGSSTPTGSFTAELTEYLLVAMDALAGPKPADNGARDPRSAAARRHDALLETLKIAISSGLVPKAGGLTSTLVRP